MKHAPIVLSLLVVATATAFGCQRAFDPQSQIESLRVIAIRMDHPQPAPGSDLTLEMITWDGSLEALRPDGTPRPIEVAWLGGCFDPKGDLYYSCYGDLAPEQEALAAGAPHPYVSRGLTFTMHVPEDLISRRDTKGSTPYGISFVFYAVCAGKIVPVKTASAGTPPLTCISYDGAPANADGFVYGYLPIYSYLGVANTNPIVNGGTFDGRTYDKACATDAECDAGQVCGKSKLCLPVVVSCAAGSACVDHAVSPSVDVTASTEPNPVTSFIAKEPRHELLYVQYMTNHGSLSGETRTIVDVRSAHVEWNGTWHPPDAAVGETRVWAVVHDDRGGVTWWWQDVVVK